MVVIVVVMVVVVMVVVMVVVIVVVMLVVMVVVVVAWRCMTCSHYLPLISAKRFSAPKDQSFSWSCVATPRLDQWLTASCPRRLSRHRKQIVLVYCLV